MFIHGGESLCEVYHCLARSLAELSGVQSSLFRFWRFVHSDYVQRHADWVVLGPLREAERMPVAVVNEDAGAQFEGKPLAVGEDLVDELKVRQGHSIGRLSAERSREGVAGR